MRNAVLSLLLSSRFVQERAKATATGLSSSSSMQSFPALLCDFCDFLRMYIFDMLLKNSDEGTRKELAHKFKGFSSPPGIPEYDATALLCKCYFQGAVSLTPTIRTTGCPSSSFPPFFPPFFLFSVEI